MVCFKKVTLANCYAPPTSQDFLSTYLELAKSKATKSKGLISGTKTKVRSCDKSCDESHDALCSFYTKGFWKANSWGYLQNAANCIS